MILPDWMIREREVNGPFGPRQILTPWNERSKASGMSYGLSCAGYDIRSKQGATLAPGQFVLLSSVENFVMPDDVIGIVHDKSTWARRGLSVFNTVIESSWTGWLTIEAVNHGAESLKIHEGDPIAQIIFHQMAAPPERGYSGRYQNQTDEPVPAKLLGGTEEVF